MDLADQAGRPIALGDLAPHVLETIRDGFYVLDSRWRFVYANRRACEMAGLPKEPILGRCIWDCFPQLIGSDIGDKLRNAVQSEHEAEFEAFSPVLRIWVRLRVCPMRGGFTGVYLVDIDEQKRTDSRLRDSEERFRRVFEQSPLGKAIAGPDFRIREVNPALCDMLGYTREELAGIAFLEFVHPEDRAICRQSGTELVEGAIDRIQVEQRLLRRNGEVLWVNVNVAPVRDEHGRTLYTLGVIEDISARKRDQERLRELNEHLERQAEERARQLFASRARLRAFFENSPDRLALIRVTADGRFLYEDINPTLERAFQRPREAVIGRTVQEVLGAEAARVPVHYIGETARSGLSQRWVLPLATSGGMRTLDVMSAVVPGETDGGDRFAIVAGRDITEREELEAQLRQAQKMEAVGQLTGGVAHDFNNLLTAVVASLELIRVKTADGRVRTLADTALRAAMRGGQLTHQLLSFSRRQRLLPTVVDLPDLLRESEPLLRGAVEETIALGFDTEPGLWTCEIDPAQFQAAMMNLVVNARDAMPEGGRLALCLRNVIVTAAETGLDLAVGDYVVLAVSDSGTGMSREVLARAFEPFFTTKDIGKGSGLGLSMVHGFARQSGGTVRIESEPGLGTTVRLYLPKAWANVPEPADADRRLDALPRSSGTVLVVEDNEDLLNATVDVLRTLNYKVFVAHTGPEALEVMRRGERIDLLLSDVVMPAGLTGIELGRQARSLQPGIKVLLTSGYTGEALFGVGQEFPFLAKPYRPAELGRSIAALLKGLPLPG